MEECKFDILNQLWKIYCNETGIKYKKQNDEYWISRALNNEINSMQYEIAELKKTKKEADQA